MDGSKGGCNTMNRVAEHPLCTRRTSSRISTTALFALPCLACFTQLPAAEPATGSAPTTSLRQILFGADFEAGRPAATKDLFFECGLNCVRLTGGGYGWAAKGHSEWAKTLATKGVQVYLQLGSHYPSADYFALKDAWLVDQNGKTGVEDRKSWAISYDHSCWPQYSYAHQGFREKLAKDFTAYLGNFPAGSDLAGVILHNEPGMHWLNNRIFDYGAPSVAAFRAWLPSQHADIAELNRRWGSNFASFAEVAPPGKPTPDKVAAWMDWRRFQVFQIADFMRWEAGFAKGVRPDLARTTNLDGPTNNWYTIRCADIEAYNRAMDTVGIDIYPTPWSDQAFVPYAVDQLQGVAQGRRAHVLECEVFSPKAGEWKKLNDAQRADLLRSEVWTMFGHGADGVLMWGFSRGDTFSVTDGEWNPRVLVCRDIVHQQRMIGLGAFRRAASEVAICLDPDAYIRGGAIDSGNMNTGSALDAEFHGIHAALAAAGIQSDVIMAAQIEVAVKRYRAIVLPGSPLMDQATADRLRAFVTAGGTVIAVQPFAVVDRWGAALPDKPGCGLAKIMATENAEKLAAANGVPEIVVNRVGKGQAVTIAASVGNAFINGKATGLPKALAGLLERAKVLPHLRISCAGAVTPDAALLANNGNRLLVVAAQGSRASATIAAENVKVSIPGALPKAVFTFPATATADGTVRSGPVALKAQSVEGACVLELGAVSSALPVLLTDGSGPLLSLALPATAKTNEATTLQVTCHNPSATALSGTIELRATGLTASAPVTVPAWGAVTVPLEFTPVAAAVRLPVGAVLRTASGETAAIPVDLAIQ